jgi:predicted AAA+ superfamily ATPase
MKNKSNFPLPEPDRRLSHNHNINNNNSLKDLKNNHNGNITKENSFSNNSNFYSNQTESNPFKTSNLNLKDNNNNIITNSDLNNNMTNVKLKHIKDMRQKILNYKLLSEKTMFLTSNIKNYFINKCNIILFGPSGSGKSSFIKSMYRALYNSSFLPPEAMKKLIIKSELQNEGTLCFTRLHLKEQTETSSGIILCDTRGHIRMDESEREQFKILLNGNIKDGVKLEQRTERNPLALWEFWKKDSELFPKDIFFAEEVGIESIPHSIVFVFDGSTDEVINKEDEMFYKDLVNISKKKGYENVHVILTRIDVFEKFVSQRNKNLSISDRSSRISTLKDEKIEKVIEKLGISRSNIHFIENYHDDDNNNNINNNNFNLKENSFEIDFHLLKTMGDIINACEMYILYYMSKNESCFSTCFGGR